MQSVPIVDVHNDLLLELDHRRKEARPFERLWLPSLRAGGVMLQVCPLYTARPEWSPELCLRQALHQIQAFDRAIRECPEDVTPVRSRSGLEEAERGERIGLTLSMEGVEALGYDVELIDVFVDLGVRMVSLTWNSRNPFADGCTEPRDGGLSRLGRALIDRLVDGHVMIDLAHASQRTFFDVLDRVGDGQVLVSHAACQAVLDTPRNLSDDQLRALAERGGVLGLMLLPLVIDPETPTVDRVLAHLEHAIKIMGIEHVGLGADFFAQVSEALGWVVPPDGVTPESPPRYPTIEALRGPDCYPSFLSALRDRGFDEGAISAIGSGNLLRFMRVGLPA